MAEGTDAPASTSTSARVRASGLAFSSALVRFPLEIPGQPVAQISMPFAHAGLEEHQESEDLVDPTPEHRQGVPGPGQSLDQPDPAAVSGVLGHLIAGVGKQLDRLSDR